jgi:light-regulated signal transduction histidine kinase (bacteriophytochrome)
MAGIGSLNGSAGSGESDLEGFCQRMAELMREVIRFQRVMVYRFDPDWNGTVIAEARDPAVASSYLGLTFPASDIPAQARELFQRIAVRPTIDAQAEPDPLLYAEGEARGADLAGSSYRAVAEAHRTYLGHMGVRASLTLALTVNGRLWGLVACHHLAGPRQVDPLKLVLFRSLSEIFSLAVARVVEREEHRLFERVAHLGQWLQRQITVSAHPDFQADVIQRLKGRLQPVLGCDSLAYRDGDRLYRSAGAPSAAAIEAITAFHARWSRDHGRAVLVTSELQGYGLDLSAADAHKAAGVVVVGGSETASLLLFRRPSPVPTTWAGDPEQRVQRVQGSDRLDPRSSFELFIREHRGDCDAWPSVTSRAAVELRDALRQAHWILCSRLDARALETSHL